MEIRQHETERFKIMLDEKKIDLAAIPGSHGD